MSIAGIPQNYWVQQGNGQVFLSWNLSAGAVSYQVQRSTDGVTFTNLAAPVPNSYLDTTVTPGIQYFYQVASVNGSGTSPYTQPQGVVPVISGQMSLGALRLAAQQRADMVNSQFVKLPEWNVFINQAAFELYDLLTDVYEDYYLAPAIYFTTDGSIQQIPVPDGIITYKNAAGSPFVPRPFFKLSGVDLGLSNSPNGWVTVAKFMWIDRNKYVVPNTASTLYGVLQLQYRLMDNFVDLIPLPAAGQPMRIWYQPRLVQLLQDTDILDGISGWSQYVIIRAAKYALDKEESDTQKLDEELVFLKKRIEGTAPNRDSGQPNTISNTRNATGFGNSFGGGGANGYGGYGW